MFALRLFLLIALIQISMISSQSDIRHRQSKRKIFLDDSYKYRAEERPSDSPLLPTKQPSDAATDEPRKEELLVTVRELRACLKQEREKYEQLFEEYEQLIEKNNLIEKEYINLKYEHNKELKLLKKSYKEKVQEEVKRCLQQFTASLHDQRLWEGLQLKIDLFAANLQRTTDVFLAKSKKYHAKDLHKTIDIIETELPPKLDQTVEEGVQLMRSVDMAMEQKMMRSPWKEKEGAREVEKEGAREVEKEGAREVEVMPSSTIGSKQIVFEDQYYGDLEDYEHLQQKIAQRRNYELLKNCSRSNADIRRKKIFNRGGQFQ